MIAETGKRIGEVLGVNYVKDIDYDNMSVRVEVRENNENYARVKYAEYRTLYFSSRTSELLNAYISENSALLADTEYLFINLHGPNKESLLPGGISAGNHLYERRSSMNTTTNYKTIMQRGSWLRLVAVLLTLVMVMGTITVSAASKKSTEVASKTKLINAMQEESAGTIVFKTDKAMSIKIPAKDSKKNKLYSVNKKLVIDAPNASVTNAAKFESVTIEAAKYYTENVSGNTITLNGFDVSINVSAKKKIKKLIVNADNADISVKKKGSIEDLVFKNRCTVYLFRNVTYCNNISKVHGTGNRETKID